YLLVAFGAALAGATNALAGGGTLITFPLLVWLGVNPISANTTNTVSIWMGSVASAFGFRMYIKEGMEHLKRLLFPSLLGGLLGAYLLVKTPSDLFKDFVPFLILFATFVLALNDRFIKKSELS
ncbi:MAG: TSUP family transporter, partial [Aquificaceae bacterium]